MAFLPIMALRRRQIFGPGREGGIPAHDQCADYSNPAISGPAMPPSRPMPSARPTPVERGLLLSPCFLLWQLQELASTGADSGVSARMDERVAEEVVFG
jgi:hypothetical protein